MLLTVSIKEDFDIWLLPAKVRSPANMLPTLGNFHIVNMMKGLMMKNCMSIARYQE